MCTLLVRINVTVVVQFVHVHVAVAMLQYHTWQFTPSEGNKYVMKPALIVWGQGQSSVTSGGKKRQFTLRAVGDGCEGSIAVSTGVEQHT